MNIDLDNDIDRLYVAPRDQFVRERDALARALRKSGDRGVAAEVAALRKPTLVAWTVNQLAHTKRRDVDLLLDAGKRIIDAQQASIAKGGRGDLDAAQASLRNAVNGLAKSAGEILGPDASAATLSRIAETLRTTATSPTGRELLARGRLTEELSETGWEIVAGFTPAPGPRPKRSVTMTPAEPEQEARRDAEKSSLAKRLRELQKARAAAQKRQRTARDRETAAAERLEELRAARATVDAELEAVDQEIDRVENELEDTEA